MKGLAFLFALLITAVVLAGACGSRGGTQQEVGKMRQESKSVDPKDAQSIRAQLKMGAGEMNLTGGADQLMEGDFSYNVAEWKPEVSYDESGLEDASLESLESLSRGLDVEQARLQRLYGEFPEGSEQGRYIKRQIRGVAGRSGSVKASAMVRRNHRDPEQHDQTP